MNKSKNILKSPYGTDWDGTVEFFYEEWSSLLNTTDVIEIDGKYYEIGDWNYVIERFGWDYGLSEYISWGLKDMINRKLLIEYNGDVNKVNKVDITDIMLPNFPIVHLDDPIVKKYLEVRKELIENVLPLLEDSSLLEMSIEDGKVDSILSYYDSIKLRSSSLSDKSKRLLSGYDPTVQIVQYKYVAYYYRERAKFFKTVEDRKKWVDDLIKDNPDYNPMDDYEFVDLVEVKGSLDDNYDSIIDGNEDGKYWFILASSIYSENIILGHTTS